MEIKQLSLFARIAELGSLTRAADTLGVTQAALSRQLAQLEAELQVSLFRRNGRGVVLSEPGRRLLEQVPMVLRQMELAERAARCQSKDLRGNFVLGLAPSLARTAVTALIQAFRAQLPDVTVRTVDGTSAVLKRLVEDGKLDCGVVYGSGDETALEFRRIAQERLYLVSPRAATLPATASQGSLPLCDIPRLPLIISNRGNPIHKALDRALSDLGGAPDIAHEIENLSAIIDLVRNGYGHSVIPLSGVYPHLASPELAVRRIEQPELLVQLSLVCHGDSRRDPLIGTCASLVQQVIYKELQNYQKKLEPAAPTESAP